MTAFADFGWQGIRLRVPETWNLGKVDGDYKSGYARLDGAEIVRAEIEWRDSRSQSGRGGVEQLVDKYVDTLKKKAEKAGMPFSVVRRAGFLSDDNLPRRSSETEIFIWESDFRAYNVARKCPDCGRVVLLRILGGLREEMEDVVRKIVPTMEDHASDGSLLWSVYGLTFSMPAEFKLAEQALKSGHLQLTFQDKRQLCRVQRLSLGRMLLKGTTLGAWYRAFFKKQLRDLNIQVQEEGFNGHEGVRVTGFPRSRLLQLLRPLPFISSRPRQYLDSKAWLCTEKDKICVVDYLYRKNGAVEGFLQQVCQGYVCHEEAAEVDARSHATLAAGAK